MIVTPKLNVIALGNEIKMRKIAACVSHGNINILSVPKVADALSRLQNETFDIILVDSLLEEAESICQRLYDLFKIPVILLITGTGANWPDYCSFKVDGFLSEESSNIELVARIKASARRKLRI